MSEQIDDAIAHITRQLHARTPGAAVVLTLAHLAHQIDLPYIFLRAIVERRTETAPYKVFTLKRRDRGQAHRRRFICVPCPSLLRAQRWIHQNILVYASVHPSSKAYCRGSSITDAAKPHCDADWLIKLDVTSFFESIKEPSVFQAYRNLGYEPLVALELARLCTRLLPQKNPLKQSGKNYSKIERYQIESLGHLPQGAPTSPILANIVARSLDEAIEAIALRSNLRYTRYADDITLSFKGTGFTRKHAQAVISECYAAMKSLGFWPNRTKTCVVPPGARKIVLGLVVNKDYPRLTREFREAMRSHIHYLKKFGAVRHAERRGFDSVIGLQNHLFGLTAFAIGIDKTWGKQTLHDLHRIDWPTTFVMPP